MSKVIGLHGARVDESGVQLDVVALLADALESARRGEVVACALVLVDPAQAVRTVFRNPVGARHALVAGAHYLLTDLAAAARDIPKPIVN